MTNLLHVLTQKQPLVTTNRALLVIDLQNDFTDAGCKLPAVGLDHRFFDRVKSLAGRFRRKSGVIWIKSVYEADRPVNSPTGQSESVILEVGNDPDTLDSTLDDYNTPEDRELISSFRRSKRRYQPDDLVYQRLESLRLGNSKGEEDNASLLPGKQDQQQDAQPQASAVGFNSAEIEPKSGRDDDLFLSYPPSLTGCCAPDSRGAQFSDEIKDFVDPSYDIVLTKTHYSALARATPILLTLRAEHVTELYLCGCFTNTSIFATAADAIRYGFTVYLVEDCLAYRVSNRHEMALKQMIELMDARSVSSDSLLALEAVTKPLSNTTGQQLPEVEVEKHTLPSNKTAIHSRLKANSPKYTVNGPNTGTNDSLSLSNNGPEADDAPELQGKETSTKTVKQAGNTELAGEGDIARGAKNLTTSPVAIQAEAKKEDEHRESRTLDPDLPEEVVIVATDVLYTSPQSTATSQTQAKGETRRGGPVLVAASQRQSISTVPSLATLPTLGPGDRVGEGDSSIEYNLIPTSAKDPYDDSLMLSETIFQRLYDEVGWQKMYHVQGEVPRLVAAQGEVDASGSMSVYRHPSDQSPPLLRFSPAVELVRRYVEKNIGVPVNHVLIQLYRSGYDYISEHSDKTLDIVRGSPIVNVSFGAQRTMRLRTKRPPKGQAAATDYRPSAGSYQPIAAAERQTQRIPMPHNSIFVLGQLTNERWLHGINADKRPDINRTAAEVAFDGCRISLTFRHIGTFLECDQVPDRGGGSQLVHYIWGQGATHKDKAMKQPVVNNDSNATEALVRSFGTENQSSSFDWEDIYGTGSNVVHFREAPTDLIPTLYLSGQEADDTTATLLLAHLKKEHGVVDPPPELESSFLQLLQHQRGIFNEERAPRPLSDDRRDGRQILFRDADRVHTEVRGLHGLILYLDRFYSSKQADDDTVDARTANGESADDMRMSTAAAYELLLRDFAASTIQQANRTRAAYSVKEHENKDLVDGDGDGNDNFPVFAGISIAELDRDLLSRSRYVAGNRLSVADFLLFPRLCTFFGQEGGVVDLTHERADDRFTDSRYHHIAAYMRRFKEEQKCMRPAKSGLVASTNPAADLEH